MYNIGKRLFSTTEQTLTKDASRFIIEGKARRVGLWLLFVTSGSFILGTCGGYTRNMRYGMNQIKWRASSTIPQTDEEWNKQYEEFKKYPEYTIRGKEVDLETFKQTYWICTVSKFFGAGGAAIFGLPMSYFWYRGYFKGPMKKFCLIYTAIFASIGFQGMYQDNHRPGQVEGEPLPPKDPYMKSLHYLMIYGLYSLGLWQCLNLLRKSPDKVKSIERYFANQSLRKHLMMSSKLLFTLVIISGCLMSGTGAGRAIVTYPKVGDKWTITHEDFDRDISFVENLYENKKVLHFTHRTLGMIFFGVLGLQWLVLLRSRISP